MPAIRYEDIAQEAGLSFRHVAADPVHKQYIIETTGSGVALLDFDQDGLLDIFLVNGDRWNGDPLRGPASNRLFRNLGGLRFEDATESAGLVRGGWGQGACVGDYDNDGHPDLFVTYYGANALYRNRGDGAFDDASERAGLLLHDRTWSTGCAFLDYDRDGLLDLALASYIDFDRAKVPRPGENALCTHLGSPVVCGLRGRPQRAVDAPIGQQGRQPPRLQRPQAHLLHSDAALRMRRPAGPRRPRAPSPPRGRRPGCRAAAIALGGSRSGTRDGAGCAAGRWSRRARSERGEGKRRTGQPRPAGSGCAARTDAHANGRTGPNATIPVR